jgi:N-acetyltransferase 10
VRDPTRMPPLLQRLSELRPEPLDYLGVSYGLTPALFRFWKRAGYVPLYLRQTENDLTGEHTCVMLRGLSANRAEVDRWLGAFVKGEKKMKRCLLVCLRLM